MTVVVWPADAQHFLDEVAGVADTVRAGATVRDRERRYDVDLFGQLGDIGFWAVTVPVEHGGLGFGPDVLVEAVSVLAAEDASIGQLPQNHFNSVERLVVAGTEEQRCRYLPPLASGSFFGNAAAEPGERPPGESTTRLRRISGGWSLTGRKVYATGALFADVVSVQALTEDGQQVVVLVPRGAKGLRVHDDWASFGQRTTASGTVELAGVRVDDAAVLVLPDDPRVAYRISALSQLLHAAIDTGIAAGAMREAVTLARTGHGGRGSGARAYGADPLGVAHLGDLQVSTTAARRVTQAAAAGLSRLDGTSSLDEVLDVFYEVVQAKVVSTRSALDVTSGLFDVGGARSTNPELGLDRYWRDARTHTLHDAVRWKPHSIGRWLIGGDVADPWSLGAPMRPFDELEKAR